MPTQRGERKLVSIPLEGGLLYGARVAEVHADLGQVEITGAYPANFVLAPSSPKPPTATKKTATGSKSGFYDKADEALIRTAGWKRSKKGRRRAAYNTTTSKCVYVTIGGVKYAWRMQTAAYNAIGADRAALGIEDADGNDLLVFAPEYPVPPRATKVVGAGTSGETSYTTFVDPSKLDSLPDGWKKSADGEYPQAAPI